MTELSRIQSLARWYLDDQSDLDKRIIRLRFASLEPHFVGTECLELGPAEGEMTRLLVQRFEHVTAVEGAAELLHNIPDHERLTKKLSLFEDFVPEQSFDTIVMDHVLEHVEHPVSLLARARPWLSEGGRLIAGVPNGHSIHRLVAAEMGLLSDPCQLNERDVSLGHRRVYTRATLTEHLEAAGLRPIVEGGVFLKPLSNQQIEDHFTEEMILGFYKVGADFPNNCAELFVVCQPA